MNFDSLPRYAGGPDSLRTSVFRLGLRKRDFIVLAFLAFVALPLGGPVAQFQRVCHRHLMNIIEPRREDVLVLPPRPPIEQRLFRR